MAVSHGHGPGVYAGLRAYVAPARVVTAPATMATVYQSFQSVLDWGSCVAATGGGGGGEGGGEGGGDGAAAGPAASLM